MVMMVFTFCTLYMYCKKWNHYVSDAKTQFFGAFYLFFAWFFVLYPVFLTVCSGGNASGRGVDITVFLYQAEAKERQVVENNGNATSKKDNDGDDGDDGDSQEAQTESQEPDTQQAILDNNNDDSDAAINDA